MQYIKFIKHFCGPRTEMMYIIFCHVEQGLEQRIVSHGYRGGADGDSSAWPTFTLTTQLVTYADANDLNYKVNKMYQLACTLGYLSDGILNDSIGICKDYACPMEEYEAVMHFAGPDARGGACPIYQSPCSATIVNVDDA